MVPETIHDQARAIFFGGDFPELTEEHLQRAIAQVGSDLRGGRLYFECNKKMLCKIAGHYILYGSEYLGSIAGYLPGAKDYARVLKTSGTPTLFVCDVPLDLVGHWVLISGYALDAFYHAPMYETAPDLKSCQMFAYGVPRRMGETADTHEGAKVFLNDRAVFVTRRAGARRTHSLALLLFAQEGLRAPRTTHGAGP